MKAKAIQPIAGTGSQSGALIYDGIKGKVAQSVRIFEADGTTFFIIHFEDDTEFEARLTSSPSVRIALLEEVNGDEHREIAASKTIPVPET